MTGREVADVYAAGSDAGPAMFREAGGVAAAAVLLTLDDGTPATATAARGNVAGYDVRLELAGKAGTVVVGLHDRTPVASIEPAGRGQAVDGVSGAARTGVRGGAERLRRGGARRAGQPVRLPQGAAGTAGGGGLRTVRRERRPVPLAGVPDELRTAG